MSNSNLITYTKLAPSNHHYNGRTHAVDDNCCSLVS